MPVTGFLRCRIRPHAMLLSWLAAVLVITADAAQASPDSPSGASAQASGPGGSPVLKPAKGSAQRKAVLDALRREIRRLHGIDVIFVVQNLNVKADWAWVEAIPQSTDGKLRLESVAALLRRSGTDWRVLEIPCAEPDDHRCIGNPKFPGALQDRFPGMPPEILAPADGAAANV
jgi:hypothetical protein